jgi:phosphatidylserine/phosphatidylglycerophosphate/cardiolipin synthase-like enzyme
VSIVFDSAGLRESEIERLVTPLAKMGATAHDTSGLHGKYLISDNNLALVTSCNLLAIDASAMAESGSEVGVLLVGAGVADRVLATVGSGQFAG